MKELFCGMEFSAVDEKLERYEEEMKRDLALLISHPSLCDMDSAAPGAPYGRPARDILDCALDMTRRMGFESVDVDGHCGYADLKGTGEGQVGVAAHLDVVPARKEDWTHDPFEMLEADGLLYGRGVSDNKGPLIASLYAIRALKECNVPMERTVRFIMGCNEEVDMSDMEYYRDTIGHPDTGFTPDGSWPVVVGEKGFADFRVYGKWEGTADASGLVFERAESGLRNNVVPAYAEAEFLCIEALPEEVLKNAKDITVRREGNKLLVSAAGTAAHASTPWVGDNALSKLLAFLSGVPFTPAGAKNYLDKLAVLCRDDQYGTGFHVDGKDGYSETTCVPSILRMDKENGMLACDLRFLVTKKGEDYMKALREFIESEGLTFGYRVYMDPMWHGMDHPDALVLAEAFNTVTGNNLKPIVLGGGSYAKKFKTMFSFGTDLPGREGQAHQADEHISVADFITMAKIYARGIYGLAK